MNDIMCLKLYVLVRKLLFCYFVIFVVCVSVGVCIWVSDLFLFVCKVSVRNNYYFVYGWFEGTLLYVNLLTQGTCIQAISTMVLFYHLTA